jgi:hypothetical protein
MTTCKIHVEHLAPSEGYFARLFRGVLIGSALGGLAIAAVALMRPQYWEAFLVIALTLAAMVGVVLGFKADARLRADREGDLPVQKAGSDFAA